MSSFFLLEALLRRDERGAAFTTLGVEHRNDYVAAIRASRGLQMSDAPRDLG